MKKIYVVFCIGVVTNLVHADLQVLKIELECAIKTCNLEKFKSTYAAFETETILAEEKALLLASCEQIVQKSKKYRLVKLAKKARYIIKKNSSAQYCLIQSILMVGFGLGSLSEGEQCLSILVASKPGDVLLSGILGDVLLSGIIACICGYYAKKNYMQAFHADILLKQEIQVLDEILACIQNAHIDAACTGHDTMQCL